MKRFALIEIASSLVVSIITDDIENWTPPPGYMCIESDDAQVGWTYADGVLSAPIIPPPTPEEIFQKNAADQGNLLNQASQAMAPVLVSLQLGDATDDETVTAREWQTYYRALKNVDLTVADPSWPVMPGSM